MKKFEGIITVLGVLVVIGMPMFLMFADLKDAAPVLSDGYITVLSYDDSIKDTIDGDFEQSFSALDGSQSRDEVVYLFNEIEDDSINGQIETFDVVIPLGLSEEPEVIEKIEIVPETEIEEIFTPPAVYEEPETCEEPVEDEIEIVQVPIIEEPIEETIEEFEIIEESSTQEIIDEFVPLGLNEDYEEPHEVIDKIAEAEEIDCGILIFADEDIDNETYESKEENEECEILEVVEINDEVPEGLEDISPYEELELPPPEAFFDDGEDEEITNNPEFVEIPNEVPEGLDNLEGLSNLEVSIDDNNIHEVRYTITNIDEFGNEYEQLVIFSY